MFIAMVLSSISTADAGCEYQLDWMNGAVAQQAIWNVSQDAAQRRFMASQLDGIGIDGSFECDMFGNLCDVMSPTQAEETVRDVLVRAAAGWSLPHLRNLLALHIDAANPNGFTNPGFTQIGHNIAVGWGGSSGPLTTSTRHVYTYTDYSPDFAFDFAPDEEVTESAFTSIILTLLFSCPSGGPGSENVDEPDETQDPGEAEDASGEGECQGHAGETGECSGGSGSGGTGGSGGGGSGG